MTEQTHLFDTIDNTKTNKKKERYFKRMRAGQITALILSITICIFTLPVVTKAEPVAFIIALLMLVLSLLSFKWPFPFLVTYTILFTLSVLMFIAFLAIFKRLYVDRHDAWIFLIISNVVYILLDIVIVQGTVAAKKYTQLKKQQI